MSIWIDEKRWKERMMTIYRNVRDFLNIADKSSVWLQNHTEDK